MSEVIKKEVVVPKEFQEILDCLKVIVKSIKDKLEIGEIVASALPPFITAVEGAQNIPTEIAEHKKAAVDAGLLFGSEVAFMFLEKDEDKVG